MHLHPSTPEETDLTIDGSEYEFESVSEGRASERAFLTGCAGSGKSYTLRKRLEEDPEYGIVAATSGVAAINLDSVTINSLLGYFDTASLVDGFLRGRITARLRQLSAQYKWLWIDEISMCDKDQLNIIDQAAEQVSLMASVRRPISIGVVGDFAQLAPVKADYAFEADCWHKYASNTEKLTKVWRQNHPKFLEGLNLIRLGNGAAGAEVLRSIYEITWADKIDSNFDGTNILATNAEVDRANFYSHSQLKAQQFNIKSLREGKLRGEWKSIPETLSLKIGARVMLLANKTVKGEMIYANGDLGELVDVIAEKGRPPVFVVRLKRNEREVGISPIRRFNWLFEDEEKKVQGWVEYMPLRLSYATTVHKSQGVSLDRIQCDIRHPFYAERSMMYVALSRVRTPEGLRIVGTPEMLAGRTKVDERVLPWL